MIDSVVVGIADAGDTGNILVFRKLRHFLEKFILLLFNFLQFCLMRRAERLEGCAGALKLCLG